ncbi:hypothetical protein ACH4PU_33355 [Streptomyces sp. NPDC021100]|uniref:hypothetical protein n=1 Tax=Streptomyces sp. NPDC021100 TaxID=3365114 RepID=UPI0037A4306C
MSTRDPTEVEVDVSAREPTAARLVGVTGSGKTPLARVLAGRGRVRPPVDEEVHRLHGVDHPELAEHLAAGDDVVLNHGLWLHADRNRREDAVLAHAD